MAECWTLKKANTKTTAEQTHMSRKSMMTASFPATVSLRLFIEWIIKLNINDSKELKLSARDKFS